jgi:inhibitor of cysteine peptidase
MLYFHRGQPGAPASYDLWQVSIEPIVDLNSDGFVNGADLSIIADHWGTDDSLCDIGPMPWGDGVVDVQDLIVIAEYLLPVQPEEINVTEENNGGQVELEQGQILIVTLQSNPTTGYQWEVVENQESILEQSGEAQFKPSDEGEPPMVGTGGWEIFRFKAISAGQMTLKLIYHRSWEEGVEPANTFSLDVIIH